MGKVLITDGLSEKGIALMKENGLEVDSLTLSPEQLLAEIPKYDGWIVRSASKATASVLEAAKNLKAVSRAGVGLDNVDIPSATKKGIFVFNTPMGNTLAAAELTIALLMALTRKIPQANISMKQQKWDKKSFSGTELSGKTVGIIGFGRIGREVSKRLKAFEMEVLAYDPYINEIALKEAGASKATLDEIYKNADYITVHVPLTPETRNLIDEAQFAKMKANVKIINVARGGVINEKALQKALQSGQISGAAIDVFESEPPTDWSLVLLDNVIATPHLGASTKEAQDKCGIEAAQQMVDVLKHHKTEHAVNAKDIKK